jgi:hypothetical protein
MVDLRSENVKWYRFVNFASNVVPWFYAIHSHRPLIRSRNYTKWTINVGVAHGCASLLGHADGTTPVDKTTPLLGVTAWPPRRALLHFCLI